jgi:glycolate oxidase FAD binding subunit
MNHNLAPRSIQNLQETVKGSHKIMPKCGGSKTALSSPTADTEILDISNISGIVSYEPAEYTITVLAGTPLIEVQQALAENDQYLPFDPPLVECGASMGGATATGLNGPGSYRFGGMRDFLLAAHFIDGTGSLVKGGARVVKNAAGFDTPKLFIGSLGQFGILVELTYKVFPTPEQFATVHLEFDDLTTALAVFRKFYNNPLEVEALNLAIERDLIRLSARIGGRASAIHTRGGLLSSFAGGGTTRFTEDERDFWKGERNFNWLPDQWALVKVPLTPSKIPTLEAEIISAVPVKLSLRHYMNGGQLLWIALPDQPVALASLSTILSNSGLSGLKIIGKNGNVRFGLRVRNEFATRVKKALDPDARFLEV